MAIFFLMGLGVGIWWLRLRTKSAAMNEVLQPVSAGQSVSLSEATRSLLQSLTTPVEVRFYIKKDLTPLPESLRAFVGRADRLVAEFERVGGGNFRVTRHDPMVDAAANATARSDGIQPIDVGGGELCYLGLTVLCNGRKEVLPRLSPDWEVALESDLSRSLARVTTPTAAQKQTASAIDPAVVKEVTRAFPDLPVISVEEGAQVLREAALEQFKAAVTEMQARVNEAQQKVVQAQGSGSESELEAARKQLQKVQSAQTDKLKEITQRLQTQIAALEQLKAQKKSSTSETGR